MFAVPAYIYGDVKFRLSVKIYSIIILSSYSTVSIGSASPSVVKSAIYVDLLTYGVLGTAVQLCDNYISLNRYLVVYPKTTIYFRALINIYIWTFLVFTYLPYQTFLPCFVDTNDKYLSNWNTITSGYIFIGAYLAYNCFFAYMFWKSIGSKKSFGGGDSGNKMGILGKKNLLHCFIR